MHVLLNYTSGTKARTSTAARTRNTINSANPCVRCPPCVIHAICMAHANVYERERNNICYSSFLPGLLVPHMAHAIASGVTHIRACSSLTVCFAIYDLVGTGQGQAPGGSEVLGSDAMYDAANSAEVGEDMYVSPPLRCTGVCWRVLVCTGLCCPALHLSSPFVTPAVCVSATILVDVQVRCCFQCRCLTGRPGNLRHGRWSPEWARQCSVRHRQRTTC